MRVLQEVILVRIISCSSQVPLHVKLVWLVVLFTAVLSFERVNGTTVNDYGSGSGEMNSDLSPLPSISVTPVLFMETVSQLSSMSIQPTLTTTPTTTTSATSISTIFQSSSNNLLLPYTTSVFPQPSTSSIPPQPSTFSIPLTSSTPPQPSTFSSPPTSSTFLQPSTSSLPPQLSTFSSPSTSFTPPTSSTPPQPSTPSQPSSSPLLQPPTSSSPSSPPQPSSTPLQPSTSPSPPITTPSPTSLLQAIISFLGGEVGFAIICAVVGVIVMLLLILFCLCCYCICKRNCACSSRKKDSANLPNDSGFSFVNKGANEYMSHNGIRGTGYTDHNISGTGYSNQSTHELSQRHYEHIPPDAGHLHYNETSIDKQVDLHSQAQHSQALHSQALHSQASLHTVTDIFQRHTLPELSPMSYSLTANYPLPLDDNELLNKLSASTLRQPTRFGLSLQNEETKSAQGSRLSITGSKASIYSSRPSIYGSRTSGLHGSRHMVYNSMTSRDSLLGAGHSRQNTLDHEEEEREREREREEEEHFSQIPSPTSLMINSNAMEVPTRDSPLAPPLVNVSSSMLGHGKRDFASLTCILDPSLDSYHGSSPEHSMNTGVLISPKRKARDLTLLTSISGVGSEVNGFKREDIILEEESSKINKPKEADSPSNKKGKTSNKKLSRLEKLTSLDYIRQSFRIKKKKVSFVEKTPETTPTPSKRKSSPPIHDTVIINDRAGLDEQSTKDRQRRISNASVAPFSPSDRIDGFFRPHPNPASFNEQSNSVLGYAQLSQPTYYLPPHVAPPYHHQGYGPYPQLSQQYYAPAPQLSQGGYSYGPSYHAPVNDHYSGRGFMGGGAGGRDPRYQEVITPDYSDITSPEHHHFKERSVDDHTSKQGSEYSYEIRPHSPHGNYDRGVSPETERYKGQSPLRDTSESPDQSHGGLQLGVHPDYNNSFETNSFLNPAQKYSSPATNSYPYSSPERHSSMPGGYGKEEGHVRGQRRPSLDHGKGGVVSDTIPEDGYLYSTSVDDPSPHHYSVQHHGNKDPSYLGHNGGRRGEHRYSGYSESSLMSEGGISYIPPS